MYLDRNRNRIRLLPLNFFNFLISMLTVSKATTYQIVTASDSCQIWDKTPRFRAAGFVLS